MSADTAAAAAPRLGQCGSGSAARAVFLLAFSLLSGCAKSPGHRATLCVAHEGDVATLDPADASDHISISVLSNIYDSLVDLDAEMRMVPGLAVSWITPEPNTWVFWLRQGVRTHAGSLLSSEDVRFSLERARSSPASSLKTALSTVESVEVAGPATLRIRTREPDPLLASRLTSVYILPQSAAAHAGERPMGTGPYRFVRRAAGLVELEAFPDCWRGRPSVARVRCVFVEPGERTLEALEREEVDALRWVPENLVGRISSIPGVRVERRPSLRALYLWMGPGRASHPSPFSDARVRRAVSLAIDRDALAKRFHVGSALLWQFVPSLVSGHAPGKRLSADPALARRLLAEAGYGGGFETPLIHARGAEREAAAVAELLAPAGIRAVPDAADWPAMRDHWQRGELSFFLGSWRFESTEASVFLKECIRTRDPGAERSWNPGFSSPRLDRMIEENFRLFDQQKRRAQFEMLWDEMADEMPIVPLLTRLDIYAVRSYVRWTPRGDENIRVAEMVIEPQRDPLPARIQE